MILKPRRSSTPWRLVYGGICGLAVWTWAVSAWADQPPVDLQQGRAAYDQYCARCHGDQGQGDGVDAKRLYPRPRDLTLGVYKFRSTASGTPPTDEDLFRTITEGLPGTNMPDWRHLDEAIRWQLVHYLKSLSPTFEQVAPDPVPVAADPGFAHVDLAKGRALYGQLGCASCHGPLGRADGPSAPNLMDDWGKPIRPADLTKAWNYRGGSDARSIMLRFLTGIDGAGMPSYAGAVSPEDAWQLAYYVTSLEEPAHWNLIAHVGRVTGSLPTTMDDPRWGLAERSDVRLRNVVNASGEWVDPPTVSSVSFRVLSNEENLAVHVSWDDPTQDAEGAHPDRLAVILRPPSAAGDVVSLQAWPYVGGPRLDLCLWSAATRQTTEALSGDFDSVADHEGPQTSLLSAAAYQDGRWQLVVQRALRPTSPGGAAAITPDSFVPLGIVVWDGANPTARAVSSWIDLVWPDQAEAVKHEDPMTRRGPRERR